MADYAKKTVAELQELLKARSLPHTGKKAELVSRLSEDDKSKQSVEVEPGEFFSSCFSSGFYGFALVGICCMFDEAQLLRFCSLLSRW